MWTRTRPTHEVIIIGWDDKLASGVWLIKNSWGVYWGDDGFMKLPYGCNNVGFAASWVTASPTAKLSDSLQDKLSALAKNNTLLEFYPELQ